MKTYAPLILAVDNSPANLDFLRALLEPSGYRVVAASNVPDALILAGQERPDLILSDLHMPKESGFDLIHSVKSTPDLKDIPFVFLSSTVFNALDRLEGLNLGAMKFIVRPIEPRRLLSEIEECLAKEKSKTA